MSRVLKGLAIAALLVTVIGAGVVLYALTMFTPQVESIQVTATPAAQVQETFDALLSQVEQGTFAGRQFAGTQTLDAQDCTFLTFVVRLKNMGFFPAEWISMQIQPKQSENGAGYDVLQLSDEHAYVLTAGSRGDLSATILRVGDASDTARTLDISCYVFGQKVEFAVQAQ